MGTEHICSLSQLKRQRITAVLASDLCGICTHGSRFKSRALVITHHAKGSFPWCSFKEGEGFAPLHLLLRLLFALSRASSKRHQLSATELQQGTPGAFKAIAQLWFTDSLCTFTAADFSLSGRNIVRPGIFSPLHINRYIAYEKGILVCLRKLL